MNLEAQLTSYLHSLAEFSPTQHICRSIKEAGFDHDTTVRWLLEQVKDRYDHGQTTRNRLAKLATALHNTTDIGPTKAELTAITRSLRSQVNS